DLKGDMAMRDRRHPDFIYTYTDMDSYEDEETLTRTFTDGTKDCPSIHMKRVSVGLNHSGGAKDVGVNGKPPKRTALNSKFRYMHIMACLTIETARAETKSAKGVSKNNLDQGKKKRVEKRLCTVKCYDTGLVLMT
ncbi:hypothetical protein HDU67_006078, partial [Dinochytrium kinnereticum]